MPLRFCWVEEGGRRRRRSLHEMVSGHEQGLRMSGNYRAASNGSAMLGSSCLSSKSRLSSSRLLLDLRSRAAHFKAAPTTLRRSRRLTTRQ